jgi:hypothetical protein
LQFTQHTARIRFIQNRVHSAALYADGTLFRKECKVKTEELGKAERPQSGPWFRKIAEILSVPAGMKDRVVRTQIGLRARAELKEP